MENNQQPTLPTLPELGAKFGPHLAQIYAEIIALEKLVMTQQAQISELTQNVAGLVEHIQGLESQIASAELAQIQAEAKAAIQDGKAEIKEPPPMAALN